MDGTPAKTAWRLWVAATCPVNQNHYPYVVWENWLQQPQMYPANPVQGLIVPNAGQTTSAHLLGPSPLGIVNGLPTDPDTGCTIASNGQTICEEVRENGAFEDYVSATGLWNRANQQQVARQQVASGVPQIKFPKAAVEIKADWIKLPSCDNPPAGVHIEQIGSYCFALAGMHLISKLRDNWVWATFEAQNLTTNPNRCVVLGCFDPWGSSPPRTQGADTQLTTQLSNLMTRANLAPEWRNYRLDGVQLHFVDAQGKPTLLGNSVIEGENAGVPLTQSSCITCHQVSSINQDGTDGISLLTSSPIGKPAPLPSHAWIHRDFVWSLGDACFNAAFQTCASPP
ncbi:MAG TPA: hypothetical protein VMV15_14925 [Candidatus Binataceae bacterium]|nr:hypothetical protein [Candidatus Binataceae bacterium]